MLLNLKKTESGLIPLDDETTKVFNSFDLCQNITVDFKVKKQRSYANHKRFFSMLQGVIHNSDHYKSTDNLLDIIKLKSGHFTTIVTHKGEVIHVPKSINFSSMNEDKFKEFFSKAIDIILEFTPEQDIDSILRYC